LINWDIGIGGWQPEIGTDGDVSRRRPRSTSDCSATEEEEEEEEEILY
jgi:hypothetical protein